LSRGISVACNPDHLKEFILVFGPYLSLYKSGGD
jgi:hypothetical protein